MTDPVPRLPPGVRLQHDDVRDERLLVFPEGVVKLSATAAEVLALCDGVRTKAEILAELVQRYPEADLAADVDELLQGLAQRGLVTDVA